ncbi:hypothetical protein SAMN04488005_2135 [Yoonia tamlensis]|uniref:Uncharacterized protein n=1 Tax=Yoonia tamlensis TaxID=390270 RepID=A0A1I6GTH6_9RHOB|nr:hypothetical protein [Yoonia tamlensis]SFR45399.1 hypothetical protein SAMN04488005_2135 [Yoonia tamlensis]
MRLALIPFFVATTALADPAQVTDVTVSGDRVSVTILHADTGWDHYADGWEVLDADGNRLGFRELAHPHVNEQPFTRSQSGVMIPEGATSVFIRTRCSVDGWDATLFEVALSD